MDLRDFLTDKMLEIADRGMATAEVFGWDGSHRRRWVVRMRSPDL